MKKAKNATTRIEKIPHETMEMTRLVSSVTFFFKRGCPLLACAASYCDTFHA